MIDPLKSPTTLANLDDHRRPREQTDAPAAGGPPPAAAVAPQSDVRLVIEKSATSDVYVYTLIDRATGRVLTSIPRHQVEAMGRSADYAAGAVVSTKA